MNELHHSYEATLREEVPKRMMPKNSADFYRQSLGVLKQQHRSKCNSRSSSVLNPITDEEEKMPGPASTIREE